MATYLQGVTDYIPQYQPFQPDLNFYGNVLQTKQTQYDTNWKALNKMYNQYYNAPLTRDNNIAKKDNYLNQIEFNLQRVSQLDLSLEQNVDQATQVFKPFYEDKKLMKDMAYTQNSMREVSFGEGLKNAYDQKQRDRYWDTGIADLNFKRQEFKEASEDEVLSFQSSKYTPYVNVIAKAQDIAKEAGLSIETPSFSKDGRWLIKTTNGEALTEPLKHLFEARLGSDPGIQDVYRTQAYVDRKTYAQSNAAQFGGDKNAAEMKYLEDSFNVLKAKSNMRYEGLRLASIAYDSKIKNIKKQIEEGTAPPEAKMALSQYTMNKEINDQVLARADYDQNELSTGQNTASTSTGFINPYGDIKSLRFKVDNGMASILMQKDLDEAANIFAFKNAKQEMSANPYAVLADKHRNDMQKLSVQNSYAERRDRMKIAAARQDMLNEHRLDSGTHYLNEETMEILPVEALNQIVVDIEKGGSSTKRYNMKEASRRVMDLNTRDIAQPYLTNTMALIEKLVKTNQMSSKEASQILGYSKNPDISLADFNTKLKKYGGNWLRKEVGHKDLAKIKNKMDNWLGENGSLDGLTGADYNAYQQSSIKFGDYTTYLKDDADWRKNTSYEVERNLRNDGFLATEYLYDNNGELRSEEAFYAALPKEYQTSKYSKFYRSGSSTSVSPTTGAPIMQSSGKTTGKGYRKWDNRLNYKDMVKAAGKVYTSGKIKSGVVGLEKLTVDGETGLFTKGTNNTWVNPKAHGTPSSVWSGEVYRDLSNLDLFNPKLTRVSFNGFDRNAWNKSDNKDNAAVFKSIFNAMKSEMLDPKSKMGSYRLSVAPIAVNSFNKAAIIIHPDATWLKTLVKSEKGSGYITSDQYNDIIQNGLSVMTDASNMTSTMYTSAFKSPLASHVDYAESYKWSDPTNPNYNMEITPNTLSTGDYNIQINYPLWNPVENKYEYIKVFENSINRGMNLEGDRSMVINGLGQKKDYNKDLHNGRY
jgi:D-ribose pyranose/furanose isomerase RbsD